MLGAAGTCMPPQRWSSVPSWLDGAWCRALKVSVLRSADKDVRPFAPRRAHKPGVGFIRIASARRRSLMAGTHGCLPMHSTVAGASTASRKPARSIAQKLTDCYQGHVQIVEPFIRALPEFVEGRQPDQCDWRLEAQISLFFWWIMMLSR